MTLLSLCVDCLAVIPAGDDHCGQCVPVDAAPPGPAVPVLPLPTDPAAMLCPGCGSNKPAFKVRCLGCETGATPCPVCGVRHYDRERFAMCQHCFRQRQSQRNAWRRGRHRPRNAPVRTRKPNFGLNGRD